MPILKNINQAFFKTWSSEMAYLTGYIAADGAITIGPRGNSFLDLQSIDEELIILAKTLFKADHIISKRQRKDGVRYRLQIGSKTMVSDLSSLGLGPKKTKRMSLPEIPQDYFFDFIRGYMDGDGSITVSPQYVLLRFTTGSQLFLGDVDSKISEMLGIKGSLFYSGNAWRLNYSGKSAMKLLKSIYKQGYFCCLKRKYEKYREALN